jgi:methanogenic corrinoid protein MtbC1
MKGLSQLQRLSDNAALFLQAILAGTMAEARRVALAELGLGLEHLYQRVVQPAMEELGRLWEQDRITVAEEHLATAVAEAAVASLYPEVGWPVGETVAMIGCVEGERHQFGARMVADLLALGGWRALFLGADVPTRALIDMAREKRPVLVGLSLSLPLRLSGVPQVIETLRERIPGVKVLVGGRAVAALDPNLLGADARPESAAEAVGIARSWLR